MKLSSPWYKLVKSGKKNVEGRIYDNKRKNLKVNDTIEFSDQYGKRKFKKKIIKLKIYNNFDKAIRDAKLKHILPGIKTYSEGLKVYHNIPGYLEKSELYGVFNIWII
jgi:ASC-1-like (ASCH) protein